MPSYEPYRASRAKLNNAIDDARKDVEKAKGLKEQALEKLHEATIAEGQKAAFIEQKKN